MGLTAEQSREALVGAHGILGMKQLFEEVRAHRPDLLGPVAQDLLALRADECVAAGLDVIDVGERRRRRDDVIGEVLVAAELLRELTGFLQRALLEVDRHHDAVAEEAEGQPRCNRPGRQEAQPLGGEGGGRHDQPGRERDEPRPDAPDQRAEQDGGIEGDEGARQRKGEPDQDGRRDDCEAQHPAEPVPSGQAR